MKTITSLAALAAALVVAAPASAQTSTRYNGSSSYQDEEARFDAAQRRFDNEYEQYQAAVDRYRRARTSRSSYDDRGADPRYEDDANYDASRYYRSGNYQERVLTQDERVYRGEDGRYYCKRNDGTTGLIVGAAAGGLFGNVIAGRRSSTVGTLLGAIAGGAAGSAIDRNQQQVRCR